MFGLIHSDPNLMFFKVDSSADSYTLLSAEPSNLSYYESITVKVYHEGSVGAPEKGLAVDIAKKQMDKIMGD